MAKNAFGDNLPVFSPVDLEGQLFVLYITYSIDYKFEIPFYVFGVSFDVVLSFL